MAPALDGPAVADDRRGLAGFEPPPAREAEQRREAAWEAAGDDDLEENPRLDAPGALVAAIHDARAAG